MNTQVSGSPRPAPPVTELTRPYWDAAREGRLVLQCCSGCGTLRHYPRLLCSVCYSAAVSWRDASGRGTVHSWTVAHHAFHPGFVADLPYTLVTVDLQEGVRALGRWRGAQAPAIGMPVAGAFEPRADGVDLVFQARPA